MPPLTTLATAVISMDFFLRTLPVMSAEVKHVYHEVPALRTDSQ